MHNHAVVVPIVDGRGRPSNTAQKILHRALCDSGQYQEWKCVSAHSRAVRGVSLNLARYLTNWVPASDGHGTLLTRCLGDALKAWDAPSHSEHKKLYSFLTALLQPLPAVLEWRVEAQALDGHALWPPMEIALLDWAARQRSRPEATARDRPTDCAYVEVSPADFRVIVLVRFLCRGALELSAVAPRLDEFAQRYG